MRQAGYDLKSQSGGKGVFAQVVLTATPTSQIGCTVDFGDIESGWNKAVEFGVIYGCEKIQRELWQNHAGVHIRVDDVSGTVVETTEMSMVFVSAMAFWKAVEIFPTELPQFEMGAHIFHFPS